MKVLVVVSALMAVSAAQWASLGNPYGGFAAGGLYAAPYAAAPYAAAPYAAMAPVPAAASKQFHAQDELGAYTYGYAGALSAKTETKNALGGTSGSYSYIDANGIKQTVNYVADAAGFRVAGTNLPVAPAARLAAPVMTLVGPAPVDDTPEVKAAKAEFMKLFAEAATKAAEAPDARRKRSLAMPVAPLDTPAVMAAKAEHAALYNAAALRAAGMAAPLPFGMPMDTPAVMAAKAEHAALYNAAALRAAAAPDFGAWDGGLALRGAWNGAWNSGYWM